MKAWGTAIALMVGATIAGCRAARPQAAQTIATSPTNLAATQPGAQPTLSEPAATGTATPGCAETQGQVIQQTMPSATAHGNFKFRVYLPPCYGLSGKKYPVLIMLHGWVENSTAMNDDQWVRLGLTEAADHGVSQGGLAPMIIVMPNGNDVDQGNDGSTYAQVIATELLPRINDLFCTQGSPAMRAIGGLSRGGFWAFSTAFQYPGMFSRIGGHSPFVYSGEFKDFNPFDMLDTQRDIGSPKVYIDHGAQDYVRDNVRLFVQKLTARGIDVQYVVNSQGSHVESYWAAHVAEYLAFYAADWSVDVTIYPNCGH